MKQVNAALKDIGIPVYAGVWRATSPNQNPPVQYCVYSTTTTEASHHDDHVTSFRTYVYLNLWSDIDPTDIPDKLKAILEQLHDRKEKEHTDDTNDQGDGE